MNRKQLLQAATTVAVDYRAKGYSLTLRQLYYRLVAQGMIPNAQLAYKRLGDTLCKARLAGEFGMDLLIDRGRSAGASMHENVSIDVNDALDRAGAAIGQIPLWAIRADRWYGQRTHVSVWVEKDALSGVFERPCSGRGVGLFACKGYPSHSALWQWLKGLERATAAQSRTIWDDEGDAHECEPIEEAIVLYFGDHDPDGWQIPRSAEEAINAFARVQGLNVPPIRFIRCGLNMDQIQEFNPPPFPAKPTSSRYEGYRDEHATTDAWELDALSPADLERMIRDAIDDHWDQDTRDEWLAVVAEGRDRLRGRMTNEDWIEEVLGD